MVSLKSKRLIVTGVFAAIALVATGAGVPMLWRKVEEELCFRRLESPRRTDREIAAKRLGELRSVRSVEKLTCLALEEGESGRIDFKNAGEHYASKAILAIGDRAISCVLGRIDGSKSAIDIRAQDIISSFGEAATGPLIEAVKSSNPAVREFAASKLRMSAGACRRAFDALVQALSDSEERVRYCAVVGLASVASRAAEATTMLLARLDDVNESNIVRYSAAFEMPHLGETGVKLLRSKLSTSDPLSRAYCANALMYWVPELEVECIAPLLSCLQASDRVARCQAIRSLSEKRRIDRERLIELLNDSAEAVRSAAVDALRSRRGVTPTALPALLRILREQPEDRGSAAHLIGSLASGASDAIPDLIALLEVKEDNSARFAIIRALGRIGPQAKSAVPVLIRELPTGFCITAEALGRIGRASAEAVSTLLATPADDECRDEVAQSIVQIGDQALPAIIETLHQNNLTNDSSLYVALIAVRLFGKVAKAAKPYLVTLINAEDHGLARLAVGAIGSLGPDTSAGSLLTKVLENAIENKSELGDVAAEALGRMRHQSPESSQMLLKGVESEDVGIRAQSLLALGRIGVHDATIEAAIRKGIEDDQEIVRCFAALALVHLGINDENLKTHLVVVPPSARYGEAFVSTIHGFPDEIRALLPALTESLTLRNKDKVITACSLLCKLEGEDVKAVVPALQNFIYEVTAATVAPEEEPQLLEFFDVTTEVLQKLEAL